MRCLRLREAVALIWLAFAVVRCRNALLAVVTGECQSGKTTFCQKFSGLSIGEVGNGDGEEVTIAAEWFPNDEMTLLDTRGYLGTYNAFTAEEVILNMTDAVLAHMGDEAGTQQLIDALIVTESLASDSTQLRRNIRRLQEIFGRDIVESMLVLGTKPSRSQQFFGMKRIDHITQVCEEMHIPFLQFQLFDPHSFAPVSGAQIAAQKKILVETIRTKVKPFSVDKIDEMKREIERIAEELMAKEPPKTKIVNVTVKGECPETYYDTVTVKGGGDNCRDVPIGKRCKIRILWCWKKETIYKRVCDDRIEKVERTRRVDCDQIHREVVQIPWTLGAFIPKAKELVRNEIQSQMKVLATCKRDK